MRKNIVLTVTEPEIKSLQKFLSYTKSAIDTLWISEKDKKRDGKRVVILLAKVQKAIELHEVK